MFMLEDPETGDLTGADSYTSLVDVIIPGYLENTPGTPTDPLGLDKKLLARAQYMEDLADRLQPILLGRALVDATNQPVALPLPQLLTRSVEAGVLSESGRSVMENACTVSHSQPVFDGEWHEVAPLIVVTTSYLQAGGKFLPMPTGNVVVLDPMDERVFLLSLDSAGVCKVHGLLPEEAATVEA
jgi:hypothetical protein